MEKQAESACAFTNRMQTEELRANPTMQGPHPPVGSEFQRTGADMRQKDMHHAGPPGQPRQHTNNNNMHAHAQRATMRHNVSVAHSLPIAMGTIWSTCNAVSAAPSASWKATRGGDHKNKNMRRRSADKEMPRRLGGSARIAPLGKCVCIPRPASMRAGNAKCG
jgi:hypothetical protein